MDLRSLTFDDEERLHGMRVYDDVGPLMEAIDIDIDLGGDEGGRVATIVDEIGDKMLPDPFLGSEHETLVATRAEDCGSAKIVETDIEIGRGEIERREHDDRGKKKRPRRKLGTQRELK